MRNRKRFLRSRGLMRKLTLPTGLGSRLGAGEAAGYGGLLNKNAISPGGCRLPNG
jgi:hypothetical protein